MDFIAALSRAFAENALPTNAEAMAKYMKGLFPFYGLKTDVRRALTRDLLVQYKDEVTGNTRQIALKLYRKPQREYHYTAIEIVMKQLKNKFVTEDIALIETLLVTHSWWDSVDTIAKYLLGGYLQHFPEQIPTVIKRFSNSDNMWLNRSVILFQLGYKKATNVDLLFAECKKHSHSKEFFIQKAIGWALREHAKTDADVVRNFVATANLKPLSTREALKNI